MYYFIYILYKLDDGENFSKTDENHLHTDQICKDHQKG